MAERIWVTVQASKDHPQVLAVQDAMQQVLDVFELISSSRDEIVWNLFLAQRTNPFVAGGEAVSLKPDVNVRLLARAQKAKLATRMRAISHGHVPASLTRSESVVVERILKRNTNGLAKTTIKFDENVPTIWIDEKRAQTGLAVIKPRSLPHVEIGSIEGWIRATTFHYQNPAILVRDRRSNSDVLCVISPETKDKIAKAFTFSDVWDRRRIIVRGRIRYTPSGSIERIDASDVEIISVRAGLTPEDLYDPGFTGDLDTTEYLEQLWGGELGS